MIEVSGNFKKVFYDYGILCLAGTDTKVTALGRRYYAMRLALFAFSNLGKNATTDEVYKFLLDNQMLEIELDNVKFTEYGIRYVFEKCDFDKCVYDEAIKAKDVNVYGE